MRLWVDSQETANFLWPSTLPLDGRIENVTPWLKVLGEFREDRGFSHVLETEWKRAGFWETLVAVERSAGSQYDALRGDRMKSLDGTGNLACLALTGKGFHGRNSRPWQVQRGNLHLSLRVNLDLPARDAGPALMMLPSLAVLDALGICAPSLPPPGVKWVNDILVEGMKLAGVLTSVRTMNGRITAATFGLGLNLAAAPPMARISRGIPACSLNDWLQDSTPALGELTLAILDQVAERCHQLENQGPTSLLHDYREASLVLGREVEIWPEKDAPGSDEVGQLETPLRRGRVIKIQSDLSLLLSDGPRPVTSGHLVLSS